MRIKHGERITNSEVLVKERRFPITVRNSISFQLEQRNRFITAFVILHYIVYLCTNG